MKVSDREKKGFSTLKLCYGELREVENQFFCWEGRVYLKASSPSANVSSFLLCNGLSALRPLILFHQSTRQRRYVTLWLKLSHYEFRKGANDSSVGGYASIYILLSPLLKFLFFHYAKAFRR